MSGVHTFLRRSRFLLPVIGFLHKTEPHKGPCAPPSPVPCGVAPPPGTTALPARTVLLRARPRWPHSALDSQDARSSASSCDDQNNL